jgi:hypothetical protein
MGTPDGLVGRRQHVAHEHRGLVGHGLRDRPQRAVGVGHPHVLRHAAVELRVDAGVAEQGPVRALSRAAEPAVRADAARDHAGAHHAVALGQRAYAGADRDHLADELVPGHDPELEAGHVAVVREQVGAAQRAGAHLHDRVPVALDRGVGHGLDAHVLRPFEHRGPHASCSISTR